MYQVATSNRRIACDLDWLANSQELLSIEKLGINSEQDLDDGRVFLQNAVDIDSKLSPPKTSRLGVYFEWLCGHRLKNNLNINIIRANQQIIVDKQTLGEFDLIIDAEDRIYHFEMAIKFYMQVGEGSQLADWVGPNLKDRFDVKYHRLAKHQLNLSQLPLVKEWLVSNDIDISHAGCICRGRLFYPYEKFVSQDFVFPDEVDKTHLKGFWMTHQQYLHVHKEQIFCAHILPRSYWLSETTPEEIINLEELPMDSIDKVTAVVVIKNQQEMMRGFIVPDDWYQLAQERISLRT